jgi:hypothetical protein
MTSIEYREPYIQALVARLRPEFGAIGIELPGKVQCSCSFAHRGGRRVLGACYPAAMAHDGVAQIKISPIIDDPVDVAAVLVHELIHACRPGAGHRKPFRDIAVAIGLEGPMRSTHAGVALTEKLVAITADLGSYPHAALDFDGQPIRMPGSSPTPKAADDAPTQTGRLIKAFCPEHGYPVRTTRVWLARMGPPICPCGTTMVVDTAHPLLGGADATAGSAVGKGGSGTGQGH